MSSLPLHPSKTGLKTASPRIGIEQRYVVYPPDSPLLTILLHLSIGSFRSHASHRTKSSSIVLLPLRRLSEIPEEAGSVIGDFQTRTPRSQITVLTPMVQQMVTSFSSQSILHTKAQSTALRHERAGTRQ